MKYEVMFLVFLTIAASCGQRERLTSYARPPGTPSSGGPYSSVGTDNGDELLLDNHAPALLLDNESASAGPVADNDRCFVCHLNYMSEDIAVVHAQANIGCADCHGKSDEHIADESWASGGNGTPPDIMYTKAQINPACLACHPKKTIDTDDHEPLFLAGATLVCTDCHGKHRLETRKCVWK